MDFFFVALLAVLVGAGVWGGFMTVAMWRMKMYPLAVAWAFAPLSAIAGIGMLAPMVLGKKKTPQEAAKTT